MLRIIKCLFILFFLWIILKFFLFKISYIILCEKIDIDSILSDLLTIFSIFFSFFLLLADKLLSIENLQNKTDSEKKYFKNFTFEVRKYQIRYYFYILLITMVLLVGVYITKNLKYIFITLVFVMCSFILSFDMVNKIIFVNKKQIENELNNLNNKK